MGLGGSKELVDDGYLRLRLTARAIAAADHLEWQCLHTVYRSGSCVQSGSFPAVRISKLEVSGAFPTQPRAKEPTS
jgi:hypothetical protein